MKPYDTLPKTLVTPRPESAEEQSSLPPTIRAFSGAEFEEAARAYLEFRLEAAGEDSGSADGGRPSLHANGAQVALFREVHHTDPQAAYDLAQAATALPEVGTEFLGFRLLEELGKGAFGKVYLAAQGDLANRPVALKVATDIFGESQTLAQLQHTNIVPIYSVHRAGSFQAVCMPYFGATTLADVLQQVASSPSLPVSGTILVSTLSKRKAVTSCPHSSGPSREPMSAREQQTFGTPPAPSETRFLQATGFLKAGEDDARALRKLEEMTYVEAVLSVAARLADALGHAHERGILHRDLKPTNILLTDSGQPMLLDFNLSRDTKLRSSASAFVGGTLPYMAPEHLETLRGGRQPVDARSDLFALGVILYELLTRAHPFPVRHALSKAVLEEMIEDRRKLPPRLRQANPAVSLAAEAVVRRCLEPDPARRYQSARDLQEDLERQLRDLPLKHTREPSLQERGRKWVRRHPRLTSMSSVGLILGMLLLALAVSFVVRGQRLARLQALDGLHQFDEEMKTAQVLLYGRHADRRQLEDGITLARDILGRYRVLENSAWREAPAVRYLPPQEQDRLADEVGELLFLLARNTAQYAQYHSEPSRRPQEYRLALSYNTLAETCYSKDCIPRAYWEQRADLVRELGEEKEAQALTAKALQVALRPERDSHLLAHRHALEGNYRQALELLQKATQCDPQNFSAWFVRGNCYYELLRDGDAVACYNTCVSLRPGFLWAWLNRGLAHLRLHHYQQAGQDFDQAIRLHPQLMDAYLNRALAREEMGQYPEALEDLNQALAVGPASSRIYFRLARVRDKAGDQAGAKRDLTNCLRSQPGDEDDWIARGLARKDQEPKGALADFDQALTLNPRSFQALQNKAALLSDKFGRDADALAVLGEVVRLYPDSVLARGGRGILLARRGNRDLALADAREALVLDPSPQTLYQIAGIYALTSKQNADDRIQALHLLSSALRAGAGLEWVDEDHDLDALRADAEFQHVVAAARALQVPAPGRDTR